MSRLPLKPKLKCEDCSWVGTIEMLIWYPFNPVDEFFCRDVRKDPNNKIAFKQLCPNCREESNLIYI